jgi:hypothetical protein
MAQSHGVLVFADGKNMPLGGSKGLSQELPETLSGVVLCGQGARKIDLASGFSYPGVEFIVLIPDELFVIQAHAVEKLSAKCSERDRVNKSFFVASAVMGIADSKGAAQNRSNESGTQTTVGRDNDPGPPHVISARHF